jgi:hypothetical protein
MPLRSTLELDEDRIMEIQSHQRELKPRARKASRRYGQETVSNAFSTSSLRRMAGVLRRWKCLTMFCTYRKLSCMHLQFAWSRMVHRAKATMNSRFPVQEIRKLEDEMENISNETEDYKLVPNIDPKEVQSY